MSSNLTRSINMEQANFELILREIVGPDFVFTHLPDYFKQVYEYSCYGEYKREIIFLASFYGSTVNLRERGFESTLSITVELNKPGSIEDAKEAFQMWWVGPPEIRKTCYLGKDRKKYDLGTGE